MKKTISVLIFFILILEARFFYIIPLSDNITKYNNYNNKLIITLFVVIGFWLLVVTRSTDFFKKLQFNKLIIIFFIIYLFELVISYITYQQQYKDLFMSSYYFLIILLYYLIMYYLYKGNSISKLINSIVIFSIIISIIFIIQAIVYNYNGELFIKMSEITLDYIPTRGGNLRLTAPSTLISFSIILSAAELLKKGGIKQKNIHIINIFLSSFYVFVVCQTRMLTITIILSIVMMIIFKSNKGVFKKLIIVLCLSAVLIFVINSAIGQNFINSFSDSENAISSTVRTEEISFYSAQFKDNFFFGRGFVLPISGTESYNIVHGYQGYLFDTDIGIIGFASVFGLVGVIWYVYLLLKLLLIIRKTYKMKDTESYIEIIGMYTLIIFMSGTLFITNSQRIIMLPIILAIIDYKTNKDINTNIE